MFKAPILLAAIAVSLPAHAAPAAACAAIKAVLDASADAWSRADLGGFMQSYENAPGTVFVGGDQIVTGYQAIRARYAARYGNASAAAMGRLRIDIVDCRPVGAAHAYVIGRYHLRQSGARHGDATGLTTLLFHDTQGGWRITADHSD